MSDSTSKKRSADEKTNFQSKLSRGSGQSSVSARVVSAMTLSQSEKSRLVGWFQSHTLAQCSPSVTAERKLLSVSERSSVTDVMKLLSEHKISAVLVRADDVGAKPRDLEQLATQLVVPPDTSFLGFVDTLDVMFFLAEQYASNKRRHDHVFVPSELQQAFASPVSVFVNESDRDPFYAVPASTSLERACVSLFKFGVHRLPLIVDNAVCATVSQSDVVKFISTHLNELEPLASRSMLDLGLAHSAHEHAHEVKPRRAGASDNEDDTPAHPTVVSVLDNVSVIDALQTMIREQVTGIAITNISGKLVGSFSASDLKGMTANKLFELETKLVDMLEYHNRTRDPVVCTMNDSLRTVLGRIVAARVHRIFVVDAVTQRLTGVITLTDLIGAITRVVVDAETDLKQEPPKDNE
jgi:5'-AMP-activated protein kinase, regulatory gamma subunit